MVKYSLKFGSSQSRDNADIMEKYLRDERGYNDARIKLYGRGTTATLELSRKLDTSTLHAIRGNMSTESISLEVW